MTRSGDVLRSVLSTRHILGDILPAFVPYTLVLTVFGAFVIWNGGIVLGGLLRVDPTWPQLIDVRSSGDKANHIPSFHIPQVYYFIGFSTAFGWPVLLSANGGPRSLVRDVQYRMLGTRRCFAFLFPFLLFYRLILIYGRHTLVTVLMSLCMGFTVKHFTLVANVLSDKYAKGSQFSIHHPFLLSDNRHYTFYLWRRIYMFHPSVPYLLIPAYIVCGWAWFLRVGEWDVIAESTS